MECESIFSSLIGIIVVVFLFVSWGDSSRYQVSNYGSQAIVLDTKTGEAWTTIKTYNQTQVLIPVQYLGKQCEYECYLPEETRNENNYEWWTWQNIKKKLKD